MSLEILTSFGALSLANPVVRALAIAVVRSLAGWLENAFQDGKITFPEIKQLFSTMCRVIPQALGLEAMVPGGSVGALFTDWTVVKLSNAVKESGTPKKK